MSFGIRAGVNYSYTYEEYRDYTKYVVFPGIIQPTDSISGSRNSGFNLGSQVGVVVDLTLFDWLHLQPGLMYIQKGMDNLTAHYIEFPLLLSLKFSDLRLNVGAYSSACISSDYSNCDYLTRDFGLNAGIGCDIEKFYIGVFYDYGFQDVSTTSGHYFYNRTGV